MVFQIVFKYIHDKIKSLYENCHDTYLAIFQISVPTITLLFIICLLLNTLTQQRKNHEEIQAAVNSPLLKKTE